MCDCCGRLLNCWYDPPTCEVLCLSFLWQPCTEWGCRWVEDAMQYIHMWAHFTFPSMWWALSFTPTTVTLHPRSLLKSAHITSFVPPRSCSVWADGRAATPGADIARANLSFCILWRSSQYNSLLSIPSNTLCDHCRMSGQGRLGVSRVTSCRCANMYLWSSECGSLLSLSRLTNALMYSNAVTVSRLSNFFLRVWPLRLSTYM